MRRRIVGIAAVLLAAASTGRGQNLVADGGFASGLGAWHHDEVEGGSSARSSEDAAGSAASGSALLTGNAATAGIFIALLTQCVPVAAGQSYVLSHSARFADGETTTGWAETAVSWDSGPICTGYISGNRMLTSKTTSGVWTATSDTFTAPPGAVSAFVQVGIEKIEAGGTLTAWVDDVSFSPAGVPPDEVVGELPVVGSLPGDFGSNFKTSLQILNPNPTALAWRLVFHPAGRPEAASDPSMGYSLAPGQSFAWDDVVGAMDQSGLGSLDVTTDALFPPVVVTRIFNDPGAAGTSGFTEPLFVPAQGIAVSAPAVLGYLLGPADVERYRYNVGVRNLGAAVDLTADVLDPAGAVLHAVTRTYPADSFEQTTAADFVGGFELGDGQSIRISRGGAAVIVYGATVDNVTNDPSVQFLSYWYAANRP